MAETPEKYEGIGKACCHCGGPIGRHHAYNMFSEDQGKTKKFCYSGCDVRLKPLEKEVSQ